MSYRIAGIDVHKRMLAVVVAEPARQKRAGAGKMSGTLHLCQAKSNKGPRGRKNDFADGER